MSSERPRWRLLWMGSASAAFNMAVDDALLSVAESRPLPTLRLYEWESPALSFGYFQNLEKDVNVRACADAGIRLVRRPTGGGVVVHDGSLTFTVVAPESAPGIPSSVRDRYRLFGDAVVAGLRELGVAASRAEECVSSEAFLPNWCLLHPTQHDVLVDGRKVAGAAQRRRRGRVLHQAYVFLETPRERILRECAPTDITAHAPRYSLALAEVAGRRLSWRDVADAIVYGFEEALGARFTEGRLSSEEAKQAASLAESLYGRDEWTYDGTRNAKRGMRND